MTTIEVHADRPYPVLLRAGALADLPNHLTGVHRVGLITTSAVAPAARELTSIVEAAGRECLRIDVPDGESAKDVATLAHCWESLAEAGFTRSDLIVGLGGGATTDLAGFVAASYLRGIDFITIPTTVLAMVDAAVGGKTGIDLHAGKNLVGAFAEPRAVLADPDLLVGLPMAEVRSGLGEVVKAGFVADRRILELIEADPTEATDVTSERCLALIGRAIRYKADIVSADLRERTSTGDQVGREQLNYGHTFGHAIEAASGYRLRHGEAVAVGMVFAAELARRCVGLSVDAVATHRRDIAALGLPTSTSIGDWATLRELMGRDKKTRGAKLRFVVLGELGHPQVLVDPSEDALRAAYAAVHTEES